MELRQLRYFVAVAHARHFTRAAEELRVAQSAVSQQVIKLEAELGIKLLSRSSRHVELTEAGELVLARAPRILAEASAIEGDIAELQGLVRGKVALGGMVPLGTLDLAELLSSFTREYPGVDVRLVEGTTPELRALVHRGELDLATVIETEGESYPDLEGERLFDEELVVVIGRGHRLARSDGPLRSSALDGERFIGFPEGSATRELIDRRLAVDGVAPRVAFESAAPALVQRLASRGLGVAILPRSTVALDGPPVELRPLSPRLLVATRLIRRRHHHQSPAAKALLRHVRAAVAASHADDRRNSLSS